MHAEIYASKHNYKKSLLYYEQCIKDKPDDALSYFGVGAACEKQFQFSKALKFYNAASQLNRDWPATAYRRGVIYFLIGKRVEALGMFAELRNYPEYTWRVSAYEQKLAKL
jgi:tetratricopeptide (TPR) repeat protein